jgi:hypothetical protein
MELGALRHAFRLAARDGRAECPPFPTLSAAKTRPGFFEVEEWEAIRAHLPSESQDVGDFAFLTGWRNCGGAHASLGTSGFPRRNDPA